MTEPDDNGGRRRDRGRPEDLDKEPDVKTFQVTKEVDPARLVEEVRQAVGSPGGFVAVFAPGADGGTARLMVGPETIDGRTVRAVINAHTLTPPSVEAVLDSARTKAAAGEALTLDEIQAALRHLLTTESTSGS